jgi:predicted HicB family RNase H-like nuclease
MPRFLRSVRLALHPAQTINQCFPMVGRQHFPGTFNVRLNPEIRQRIAMRAARDGVSLNKLVARTLETAIK